MNLLDLLEFQNFENIRVNLIFNLTLLIFSGQHDEYYDTTMINYNSVDIKIWNTRLQYSG